MCLWTRSGKSSHETRWFRPIAAAAAAARCCCCWCCYVLLLLQHLHRDEFKLAFPTVTNQLPPFQLPEASTRPSTTVRRTNMVMDCIIPDCMNCTLAAQGGHPEASFLTSLFHALPTGSPSCVGHAPQPLVGNLLGHLANRQLRG